MVLTCKQVTRGDSHMKAAGMLDVSLRGVNFGFWSFLGCSGQNVIVFSRKGLIYDCTRRYIFCQFVLFTQFMSSKFSITSIPKEHCNKLSLLGVKKGLAHGQVGLLKGSNSNFPTSIPALFLWESPPG